MSEKHSPLPWAHRTGLENEIITDADEDIVCRMPNHPENGKLWHLDAPLIVRSVNALPELVKALEPLAAIANEVFRSYETTPGTFREAYSDEPDDRPVWGFNRADLTYGHLRAARAALAKVKP